MADLQTQLLGQTVYIKEEKRKDMGAKKYKVEAVYVENGAKLVISDEYGGLKEVSATDVELYVGRSW